MIYPCGRIVTLVRDGYGRVLHVLWQENSSAPQATLADIPVHWPFGPPWQMTYGNGLAWTRTLDLDYRETQRTLGSIMNLSLGYDAASNIASRTDAINSGRSETFGYDALDRLISATGAYGTLGYTYDANGNRLTRTSGGTDSYTYFSGTNRLEQITGSATRNFTDDAAGELATDDRGIGQTFAFAHDSERRPSSLTVGGVLVASYAHDAMGRRVRKAFPGATYRQYAYTPDGRISAERDQTNQSLKEIVYLEGEPLAELVGAPGSTVVHYVHNDHIGMPRLVTDSTGAVIWDAVFQPFGGVVSATGSGAVDHRFPGQFADADSALNYNLFRDYDPTLGRYIQIDPIGLAGELNRYAYVGANPMRYTDPEGLQAILAPLPVPPLPIVPPKLAQDTERYLNKLFGDLIKRSQSRPIAGNDNNPEGTCPLERELPKDQCTEGNRACVYRCPDGQRRILESSRAFPCQPWISPYDGKLFLPKGIR